MIEDPCFLITRVNGQDVGKRRLSSRGGSLHDGFGVFNGFGICGEHLALLLLLLQNTGERGNRDWFDSFGGYGGFGHDSCPP